MHSRREARSLRRTCEQVKSRVRERAGGRTSKQYNKQSGNTVRRLSAEIIEPRDRFVGTINTADKRARKEGGRAGGRLSFGEDYGFFWQMSSTDSLIHGYSSESVDRVLLVLSGGLVD